MKRGIMLMTCALLIIFCCAGVSAAIQFIPQDTKIVCDDENFLIFEDIGRKEYRNDQDEVKGMTAGRFVRLHLHRDGREEPFDLVNLPVATWDSDRCTTPPTQVKEIRYRDRNHVWLIARAGHRGDTAILLDLSERQIVRKYGGRGFALSPDAQQIAFYYSFDREFEHNVVFVDDTMVYPVVQGGFVRKLFSVPKTEAGVAFDAFTKDIPPNRPIGLIEWQDASTIAFPVLENIQSPDEERLNDCRITGLTPRDGKVDPAAVRIQSALRVPPPGATPQ